MFNHLLIQLQAPVYTDKHGLNIRFILNRTRKEICFAKAALDGIDLIDRIARVHVAELQRDKFWILTDIGGTTFECQAWSTSVVDISLNRAFDAWVQSHDIAVPSLSTLPVRGKRYKVPRSAHGEHEN